MNNQAILEDVTRNNLKKHAPGFSLEDFTGENDQEIINEVKQEIKLALSDFAEYRITKGKNILHPVPTITMDGAAIAAPQNLLGISAQIKAGKSAIKSAFIAGTFTQSGTPDGFPTIVCEPANGKAIVDLDTVQSEADQQDNLNSILNRAGLNATPENLQSYNIRQLSMTDYREFTDNICRLCAEKFNGIHLITIDGGADFISSVNNEE